MEKHRQEGEYAERRRNIFYDTDNIAEEQHETIRVCPDCSGAVRIDSASSRKGRLLAVHIPRSGCGRCQEVGYRWYETADRRDFRMAFLQDRRQDRYLARTL